LTSQLKRELFAFAAPDQDKPVFAAAMTSQPFGQTKRDPLTVRLRAGPYSWAVQPFVLWDNDDSFDGIRVFSGRTQRVGDDRLRTIWLQ
jgi:hypothetical protein